MEQKYLLKGLDCPHCSALIAQEVAELPHVTDSQFNLMNQCLTVQCEKDLLPQIEKIVHAHEPDVEVSHWEKEKPAEDHGAKWEFWRLIVAGVLFAAGIALPLPVVSTIVFVAAYIIAGWDVVWQAVKNILRGQVFDENFLMSLASIGAFAMGEHHEAVAVMLFYQVGEYFQSMSVRRSRRSISDLMNIRPDHATVLRNGGAVKVAPEQVAVGEVIMLLPGERVPLDGTVLEGSGELDTSALTGESMPRSVQSGDTVLSGCINLSGTLAVTVTKPYGESTAAKIIDMVENASARKAPAENFITVFARYYTPVVVILAAALAFLPPLFVGSWMEWIRRGMVFLVVSCPCALVISVPLTYFGGIGACSRHGILVKGGNYLDALTKIDTVVFDKTGTLTRGEFSVRQCFPAEGFTEQKLLYWAAQAEQFSTHPIAKSVRDAHGDEPEAVAGCREVAGMGVIAGTIAVGNRKLMETENIPYTPCEGAGTAVYVAVDGVFAGSILIADAVKPDSAATIQKLKALGVQRTVMLTGDSAAVAEAVATELQLDEYHAQLLPQEKLRKLETLSGKVVFVGDGINDAPCLARADVGIAMGGLGSDAAIEASDVVLMTDEPGKLCDAIRLARDTRSIVVQNIVFALGVKGIILVLGALGIAGMWAAVFADVGVAMLAVLNAMRMLKK